MLQRKSKQILLNSYLRVFVTSRRHKRYQNLIQVNIIIFLQVYTASARRYINQKIKRSLSYFKVLLLVAQESLGITISKLPKSARISLNSIINRIAPRKQNRFISIRRHYSFKKQSMVVNLSMQQRCVRNLDSNTWKQVSVKKEIFLEA